MSGFSIPGAPSIGGSPGLNVPAAALGTTAVMTDGWRVTYPGAESKTFSPDTSPETLSYTQTGFDATGAATTYARSKIITTQVRQAYPATQASPYVPVVEIGQAALSDYIYRDDITPSGVTNNSTVDSPPPVANWIVESGILVGDSLTVELCAFHRDGRGQRPVAGVTFQVTDSGGTVHNYAYPVISGPVVSSRGIDLHAVICYPMTFDLSGYPDGPVTVNAKAYPWAGTVARGSVADSTLSSVPREFSPRVFYKNTSRFNNPPRAYVDASGSDTTGVWSTTDSTAAASPFLTINGAISNSATTGRGIAAQTGFAFGDVGGAQVRVRSGTFDAISTTVARTNANAIAFTITRDPAVAATAAIVNWTSGNWALKCGTVRWHDVSIIRAAAGQPNSGLLSIYSKALFNNNSISSTWLPSAASSAEIWVGGVVTNGTVGIFGAAGEHRLLRGLVSNCAGATEHYTTVGCTLGVAGVSGLTLTEAPSRTFNGAIMHGNLLLGTASFAIGAQELANGYACVQNVSEFVSTSTTTRSLGISNDSLNFGNTHVILWNNTWTGAGDAGRCNWFYDWDDSTTRRTSTLMSVRGELLPQPNIKGDLHVTPNGARLGNRAPTHGVGIVGLFGQYGPSNLGTETFYFPGLKASVNVNKYIRNDPLFTNDQSTSVNSSAVYAAGAGGGTYSLQSGSPCKNRLADSSLPFDFAGNSRPTTNDTTGAYA